MTGWAFAALFVVCSALLLGAMKRCDPARERSIYYRRKGRRE